MKELARLFPYLKKHKLRLMLGFLFVTISNICSTSVPKFVGSIVDGMQKSSINQDSVNSSIGIILLLTIGSGFFMFLTRKTIIVSSRLIEYELRNDLLSALERQSLSFYHKNSTGSLMALTTNDISAMREFLGPALMYSANTLTTFSFALAFMGALNPSITMIALLPLPFMAFLTYVIGKKVHIGFREVQEQFSTLTAQAQEAFSGVRVIRAYRRESHETKEFEHESSLYQQRNIRLAFLQSLTMPSMMALVGFSNLLVLGYGGMLVIQGKATIGDLSQFFIYLNQLIWPVAAIGWVTNLIQRAAASAKRVGDIMDMASDINDDNEFHDNVYDHSGITFQHVGMKYPGRTIPALEHVHFTVPKGTSLGIVGATGSGKSTIAALLPRLFDPTNGDIFIHNVSIKHIPLHELRSKIGLVQQETFLFSMSLADNIRFGKPNASIEEVHIAAELAGLAEDIATFPKGYDTIVGERGITLSGGQKQRTAIARAIIRNPEILIFDDVFSAVDTATEEHIIRGLKSLMVDRTTIIIAHRISTVALCERIIVLDQGNIVEQGTHEELLAAKGMYFDMYERQQLEEEFKHYSTEISEIRQ
ncbi:MAG: ABC transporter ATP-binding protein [Bacteroidetes bacterium]|nr:ABC transporter ATP-binding protein [bacterium]NBP63723.1 ABC transporter ATP-binding protein [Bacteroidota bacterium]